MPTTINLRIVLWAVLLAALFVNYQQWMHDYPPQPVPVATGAAGGPAVAANPGAELGTTAPTVTPSGGTHAASPAGTSAASGGAGSTQGSTLGGAAPVVGAGGAAGAAPGVAAPAAANVTGAAAAAATTAAGIVHVRTDVLDLDISLAGGEFAEARLLRYPISQRQPDVPVTLLDRSKPEDLYVVQGGLAGNAGEQAPNHLAVYTAAASDYRLQPGQNEIRVPLTWTDGQGVTVTKTVTLRRGSYAIQVGYDVTNHSGMPWSFAPYAQILRNNIPVKRSMFRADSYAFKGPAFYDGKKYEKLNVAKDTGLDQSVNGGWIAAMEQHFVAAVVPPEGQPYRLQLKTQGNEFLLSATGPSQTVAPGGSAQLTNTVFVGPKLQDALDAAGPRLDLVADYGKLTFLAKPLFRLLNLVHAGVHNWGWTIIIVTFLLKLLFYPLSEASGRSMAKMKALAPRMTNLREMYKDDREKLNRGMMEMYKREKVNPVAGCLPMLIQVPIFLAFYWVLRDSVELRQAPFMGWIRDLSAQDPYYVLPILMAAAMFVQYKVNPQAGDPMQQKIFMFMPLAMSVMFAFFPAGLVLYYVTNTVLSILQQWNINRRIEVSARARN